VPTVKEVIGRRLKGIRGHVAVAVWCEEDVIDQAKHRGIQLGHKSAGEIIDDIDHHQDCSLGISWDTLDCYIDDWKREHPHYRRCQSEEEEE
jgi:hypothetical protein